MPAAANPNLRRAVVPPSLVTAVKLIRARQRELEALNGEKTDLDRGYVIGLVEAQAMILGAIVDEANNPMSPL